MFKNTLPILISSLLLWFGQTWVAVASEPADVQNHVGNVVSDHANTLLDEGVNSTSNVINLRQDCWQYSREPYRCNHMWGCYYDQRFNRCMSRDDGGNNHSCSFFDGQPNQCQRYGCFYDYRTNRCRRGGNGEYWTCYASDSAWEEHRNGHAGTGWNYNDAYYDALRNCQSFHSRCHVTQCFQSR